jgi:hypothetical protein
MGTAGIGGLAGALLGPRIAGRAGPGPMMLAGLAITPLTQIPLLLATTGRGWQIALAAALAIQLFCASALGTTQRSISWGVSVLSHVSSPGSVNGFRLAVC